MGGAVTRAVVATALMLLFTYMHRSGRKAGFDDGGIAAVAVAFAGISSLSWQDVFVKWRGTNG